MSKKKLFKNVLSAQLGAKAVASKQVSFSTDTNAADAPIVEAVLLPVLPASPFTTVEGDMRSGVQYVIDASMVAGFNAGGRKANLSIEHSAIMGRPDTRSRGYCVQLTNADMEPGIGIEPGITYGWFVLSALGKQELADGLWLYTSAEISGRWLDENTFVITKFNGHTLTNSPATEMPSNFTEGLEVDDEDAPAETAYTSQLTAEQMNLLAQILAKLGVPAETPDADVLARVDAVLTPAPAEAETALTAAGFTLAEVPALVRPDAFAAIQVELTTASALVTTLTAEVTSLKAAHAERQVVELVNLAITTCKAFTPAMRDSLLALGRADFASLKDAVDKAEKVTSAGSTVPQASTDPAATLTPEQLSFCKAYGIDPAIYAKNLSK